MNSLYSFSVDAGAETAIARVEREIEAETFASGAGRAGADTLTIGVALGIIDEGVVVFDLEEPELLEREDLWELLADLIRLVAVSLLAML